MQSPYAGTSDGSEQKYERLYERYKGQIYGIALEKLGGDEELACRTVKATFSRAFENLQYVDRVTSFKAQAFLVANLKSGLEEVYKDGRAKMGLTEPDEEESIDAKQENFDVNEVLARNEMIADLARYTEKLTFSEKQLLFFLFFMELPQKEVAKTQGLSSENVRWKVEKIKRKMARLMLAREGLS